MLMALYNICRKGKKAVIVYSVCNILSIHAWLLEMYFATFCSIFGGKTWHKHHAIASDFRCPYDKVKKLLFSWYFPVQSVYCVHKDGFCFYFQQLSWGTKRIPIKVTQNWRLKETMTREYNCSFVTLFKERTFSFQRSKDKVFTLQPLFGEYRQTS